MLTVRLNKDLENRLGKLAHTTGRSKSYYAQKAISEFLEDKQDYLEALAVLEKSKKKYTIEEAATILGIDL